MFLRKEDIEKIAPLRSKRVRHKTQDSRRLRRYQRRWIIERVFAWMPSQRRVLLRWEYYLLYFLGSVQLASIVIVLGSF
jgi:hypothetical protein